MNKENTQTLVGEVEESWKNSIKKLTNVMNSADLTQKEFDTMGIEIYLIEESCKTLSGLLEDNGVV